MSNFGTDSQAFASYCEIRPFPPFPPDFPEFQDFSEFAPNRRAEQDVLAESAGPVRLSAAFRGASLDAPRKAWEAYIVLAFCPDLQI